MAVLWAQVEAHKAYVGAHEAHVEAHEAHVGAHKAYVELHKVYVASHKRSGTPCRGTQDARKSPELMEPKKGQGTKTV